MGSERLDPLQALQIGFLTQWGRKAHLNINCIRMGIRIDPLLAPEIYWPGIVLFRLRIYVKHGQP